MVNIEITSKETIKPSSPTPLHLRNFRLSLFDQLLPLFPPAIIPLILYYNETSRVFDRSRIISLLKRSLSDALTLYYPFAGRMKGESSVDCNDKGIDFMEARVDSQLSDIIDSPRVEVLNQFLPTMSVGTEEDIGVHIGVQVNLFTCGGIAIGIYASHRIADGCTLSEFVKAWAALARGDSTGLVSPSFVSATLFPPKEPQGYKSSAGASRQKPVTRRFCFSASKLATLKDELDTVEPPSRVELVTALIWKCAMARQGGLDKGGSSVVTHSVNVRRRMDPPLPEHAFGNLIRGAFASTDGEMGLVFLVGKLREGIRKIDSEYLKTLQGENGWDLIMKKVKAIQEMLSKGEVGFLMFTSWCRFPIYEADFGFGKPVWVSSAGFDTKNTIFMMDSMSDVGGIEAWVTMDEEDMVKFEKEPELVAFVLKPFIS